MRVESRLSWLAAAAGSALCAAVAVVGADARWLAALGGAIAHARHIPSSVPYAAAPSHDWVNVPALGELVFHVLWVAGGERGLILAQAIAVAVTFTLLVRDMRASDAPDGASALVLVALPFGAIASLFVVRAQLFSLPLFALTVFLLRSESRARSRRIWLLVPLVALWSNLHGGVLIGLVVAAVYLVLERARREPWTALGVLLASCGALFATPGLTRTADYYNGVLHSEPAASGFGLWASLSLRNPLDLVFLALAIPLVWFAVRSRPKLWELACIVLLAVTTVHVSRNSIWLLLFVAAPAAAGAGATRVRSARGADGLVQVFAWSVPLVLVVAAVTRTPVQTVAGPHLRAQAAKLADGRPILADDEDAEALALDGRRVWIANPIDAFDERAQDAYLSWLRGSPRGDALLRRHDVVLVQSGSAAQRRVAHMRGFRAVGRDGAAVLYRRVS
ncbi:MAG: hypothetical protein ACJ74M_08870 [Gaiellaceae bacterium]